MTIDKACSTCKNFYNRDFDGSGKCAVLGKIVSEISVCPKWEHFKAKRQQERNSNYD